MCNYSFAWSRPRGAASRKTSLASTPDHRSAKRAYPRSSAEHEPIRRRTSCPKQRTSSPERQPHQPWPMEPLRDRGEATSMLRLRSGGEGLRGQASQRQPLASFCWSSRCSSTRTTDGRRRSSRRRTLMLSYWPAAAIDGGAARRSSTAMRRGQTSSARPRRTTGPCSSGATRRRRPRWTRCQNYPRNGRGALPGSPYAALLCAQCMQCVVEQLSLLVSRCRCTRAIKTC